MGCMDKENDLRRHRCCFAGHRPDGTKRPEKDIKASLEAGIKGAISGGYTTFITGMCYGVDLWAAEIILEYKKSNPDLRLIAVVPYEGFDAKWANTWKKRYKSVLDSADFVKKLGKEYTKGCFQYRNQWMVDHSSFVIAVFNGQASGTKNTIDYAIRKNVPVLCLSA